MVSNQESHKPGVFKKPPKPHKTGRHRSKGAVARSAAVGKVSIKQRSKHAKKEMNRIDRRNQMMQNRSKQRMKIMDEKRKLGGKNNSPILIVVIALQEDVDVHKIVDMLAKADEEAIIKSGDSTTHISSSSLKQRFSVVVPPQGDLFSTLDLVKVSNTVLFVTSATYEIDKSRRNDVFDSWGEQLIQSISAQGLPTPILAVTNLKNLAETKRQAHKNHVQKSLQKWLPEEKIMDLNETNAINILRTAGSQKQKSVTYRNKRSYLLAEDIKFHLDDNEEKNFGTLEVSGFLQGLPLSVYGLVHIPGFGDYQMSKIMKLEDPLPFAWKSKKSCPDIEMNEMNKIEKTFNVEDASKQESLESENIPDPMDSEQTWPTKEELDKADKQKQKTKLVPKGTSAYQAAWIPDVEGEDYMGSDDDDDDKMTIDQAQSEINSDDENPKAEEDPEEYETVTISETNERYDEKMDLYEEKQALLKVREAKEDAEFPDEVTTPQDMLAKIRFQKYRGLDSFRTTFWDRKENLPYDYARIFQFQNIDRTRRRVIGQREDLLGEEEEYPQPGSFITISIKGISKDLYESHVLKNNLPLVVIGLLEYEHKMSVLNFVLHRTLNSEVPIKSKERLIFQCGFRRFTNCPIFSQHTNGKKHKFERFFQSMSTVVATTFAPITFPPCPVLCYLPKTDGNLELVATGSLLSVNPDRLVIKRVILSGHPLKVHKKSAVIRFMFFHREDIKWFKPVKLHTKYGRKGHIKEPLGTHGHMKCIFDGKLKSQDTILMNLYKRVFPKWTYEPLLRSIRSGEEKTDETPDVQME